jgi:hypothetical protein
MVFAKMSLEKKSRFATVICVPIREREKGKKTRAGRTNLEWVGREKTPRSQDLDGLSQGKTEGLSRAARHLGTSSVVLVERRPHLAHLVYPFACYFRTLVSAELQNIETSKLGATMGDQLMGNGINFACFMNRRGKKAVYTGVCTVHGASSSNWCVPWGTKKV